MFDHALAISVVLDQYVRGQKYGVSILAVVNALYQDGAFAANAWINKWNCQGRMLSLAEL